MDTKEINPNEPVSTIMTKKLVTVNRKTRFSDIRKLLTENNFSHLPVVENNHLVGLVSTSDILRYYAEDPFNEDPDQVSASYNELFSVDHVMQDNPMTINPTDSIKTAAEIFCEVDFHSLPVVDKTGLVGMVTSTDIIRHYLRCMEKVVSPDKDKMEA